MTHTFAQVARPLQMAGLLGAVVGLALALLSGSGTDMILGVAGSLAVLFDAIAIRARSIVTVLVAAAAKPIVTFLVPTLLSFGGGAVEVIRPVDPGAAWSLLLLSAAPSVLGAVSRMFSR